jgi:RNA polymerase sigma-70 factor (ECF subfamily)
MLDTITTDAAGRPQAAIRNKSDESLIASIAKGDRDAMEVFYVRHKAKVLRCAMRFVRNPSAAEEVMSDVFQHVWRRAGDFKSRSQVSTWLLAIARNKALDVRCQRSAEPLDQDFADTLVDTSDDPETTMHKKESYGFVRECLTHLSPAHRTIIDLIYLQEKPIGEVARLIKVPENTVKTRMFYARQRMKGLLVHKGIDRAWHWVQ